MVSRVSGRPVSAAVLARVLRPAILVLPLALAGCGATEGIGSNIMSVVTPKPKEMDPAIYAATPVCPNVEIRDGTEFMPVFKPGKFGDTSQILFQASVQRVARDCDMEGENVRVRVGIAGRVLSGPTGATGASNVPVRVAVTVGDRVVYSKLHQAAVDVQAPDYSALWSVVDDAVVLSIADSKEATIYAGLDGKGEVKGGKDKAKKPTKG
ncbi:MAG: hypothetical protein OEL76_11830 [Siculibacillus sp.]|nr:hypothetical protein [Siculibacillus sp.]